MIRCGIPENTTQASGEALAGKHSYGFDQETIASICSQIEDIRNASVQVSIVIRRRQHLQGFGKLHQRQWTVA